jgi:fructose-1,6-bisphosphatase
VQNCILNVCQPGSSLLAAGYCLYSSSTVFVITVGDGVYGFTYDSIVGEFIMSHPNMKVGCHAWSCSQMLKCRSQDPAILDACTAC